MENQYQELPNDVQFLGSLSESKPDIVLINYHQNVYVLKAFRLPKEQYFLNEVKVSSKLNHPNILSLREFGKNCKVAENYYFTITDFMANGTLSKFFEKKINLNETLQRCVFHYLVAGVEHMHQNDCAHLDLKPDNIMIGDDYQPKIFDFDLSHCAGDQFLSGGTKNFRAPELMDSDVTLDPVKCDVYSLGIILFMLSTGGLVPFQETDEYELDEMKTLIDSDPEQFWAAMENIYGLANIWTNEFKILFQGMVNSSRNNRFSLEDVKASQWYKGLVLADHKFCEVINEKFTKFS